jgi:hypothetical protein
MRLAGIMCTMSTLACSCSHAINDTGHPVPHKAAFVPDENLLNFRNALITELALLVRGSETPREWAERIFGPASVQAKLEPEDMLHDFLVGLEVRYMRDAYECIRCGRLWLQSPEAENEFLSFRPPAEAYLGALRP